MQFVTFVKWISNKHLVSASKTLEKKGISQEKLTEFSELHRTYISSIELGKRNVALENIEKLAKALGCTIEDLFKTTVK